MAESLLKRMKNEEDVSVEELLPLLQNKGGSTKDIQQGDKEKERDKDIKKGGSSRNLKQEDEVKEKEKEKEKEKKDGSTREVQQQDKGKDKDKEALPSLNIASSSKDSIKAERTTPRDKAQRKIDRSIQTDTSSIKTNIQTPRTEKGSIQGDTESLKADRSRENMKRKETESSNSTPVRVIEYDGTNRRDCIKVVLVGVVMFLAGLMFVAIPHDELYSE